MDRETQPDPKDVASSKLNICRRIGRYILSAVGFKHEGANSNHYTVLAINQQERVGYEGNGKRDAVPSGGCEPRDSGHGSDGKDLCDSGVEATSTNRPEAQSNPGSVTSNDQECGPIPTGSIGCNQTSVATDSRGIDTDPGNSVTVTEDDRRNTEHDSHSRPDSREDKADNGQSEWNDFTHREYNWPPSYSSRRSDQTTTLVQEGLGLCLGTNQVDNNICKIGDKKMAFSLSFKNMGHYFATGFKYVAIGVKDIVTVANKAQIVQPEVDLLVGALAGPIAVKVSDLAFRVLGETAASLTSVGADATAQQAAQGVNLLLDAQTVNDIKAAALQIEAIIKAVGGSKPVTPAAPAVK